MLAAVLLLSACGAPAAVSNGTPADNASVPASATTPASARTAASVVPSDPFGGYSLDLPAGTVRTGAVVGRWGEVRTSYQTPAAERVTTIDFAPDFGWSELSEELTSTCPGALEGPQQPIRWAGSDPGGYTGWDRQACRSQANIVTFVDFSDEGVAVIYDANSVTPSAWMVSAVEGARRVSGLAGTELRFLIDHRNDRKVDRAVWADACAKVFGSASDIASAFATEAKLSGEIYGDGGPVCEYGPLFFGLSDLEDVTAPGSYGWGDFGADGCRLQDAALFFYECRQDDVVVHAGLRNAPTDNDRTQMARIVQRVRDQVTTS
jgi:hypothetical protein